MTEFYNLEDFNTCLNSGLREVETWLELDRQEINVREIPKIDDFQLHTAYRWDMYDCGGHYGARMYLAPREKLHISRVVRDVIFSRLALRQPAKKFIEEAIRLYHYDQNSILKAILKRKWLNIKHAISHFLYRIRYRKL